MTCMNGECWQKYASKVGEAWVLSVPWVRSWVSHQLIWFFINNFTFFTYIFYIYALYECIVWERKMSTEPRQSAYGFRNSDFENFFHVITESWDILFSWFVLTFLVLCSVRGQRLISLTCLKFFRGLCCSYENTLLLPRELVLLELTGSGCMWEGWLPASALQAVTWLDSRLLAWLVWNGAIPRALLHKGWGGCGGCFFNCGNHGIQHMFWLAALFLLTSVYAIINLTTQMPYYSCYFLVLKNTHPSFNLEVSLRIRVVVPNTLSISSGTHTILLSHTFPAV